MSDEPDDYEIPLEGYEVALGNDLSALQARIEELEAEVKSMAMDCLTLHGQASDAYQAQLLAEAKLQDQIHLIEQLFSLLEITEQKEDGRYFHPNIIRSSRALDAEKLEKILAELKRSITANDKSDG